MRLRWEEGKKKKKGKKTQQNHQKIRSNPNSSTSWGVTRWKRYPSIFSSGIKIRVLPSLHYLLPSLYLLSIQLLDGNYLLSPLLLSRDTARSRAVTPSFVVSMASGSAGNPSPLLQGKGYRTGEDLGCHVLVAKSIATASQELCFTNASLQHGQNLLIPV